jgi:hypothetical protein
VERLALELVDSGLIMVSHRGHVSASSPGLAIIDGNSLEVGHDAARSARLKPRRLHSHFWQSLGTTPLERPFPHHLRTADLAHAHLQSLWTSTGGTAEEVLVAVPGLYSQEQLALLLGIAGACGMPIRGLVDVAVAAAADRETHPCCLHLDLHLHRAVLTEMEHGSEIVRRTVEEETRVGLLGLHDIWARMLAQKFVRMTRFDPLHKAATDQVLYIQLPDHLAALDQRESTPVTISSGGRRHTIELERRDVVAAATPAYEILSTWVRGRSSDDETTLLLGDRIAALPGLATYLRENTNLEIATLHPAASGSAVLHHADRIRSSEDALPLVTRLPGYDARPPGPVTISVNPPPHTAGEIEAPTHLVVGGVAHQITDQAFPVGTVEAAAGDGEEHATIRRLRNQVVLEFPPGATVLLNGEVLDGDAALTTGDRLRLGSSADEILLVTMAE